ncbi:hypothetical protein lerEdw1_011253 [Lerista edwardsae]|nr:hypothetical protein lerEdw1_011253 [Lerista edwardsae]
MKTWPILIALAISVISSSAQVAYGRTNEAGTPLPIQDAETEDLEQERTTDSKDSEKGMLSWFWSFDKKKPERTEDLEHQRALDAESKDSKTGMLARLWSYVKKKPERTEDLEHQRALDAKSKGSKTGMLARLWSFMSKKVAYNRTNEAESPHNAETEDPELERAVIPCKDSEKGMLARLWSFVKKKRERIEDLEHQRALDAKTNDSRTGMLAWLWSYVKKKPERTEDLEHQRALDAESKGSKTGMLARLWSFMSKGEDLTDVDLKSKNISSTGEEKWTEEAHPSSRDHNHTFTLPSQDTSAKENEDGIGKIISTPAEKEKSHEVEGKGEEEEDDASKKLSLSEDHCQGCLSVTEPLSGNPTTPEPLPTTERTTTPSVPPRRNPWATCNHSTPEMEGKVAAALTEFALNFYKKATEFEKDSNIVFSPISISVILSNLLLGACGETKERLEELLSYPEDVTCVHAALKNLQKSEALALASAIFYQPTLNLNDEFRSLSDKFYQSKIRHLTNDSHQDVMDINAWVSKNTDHKIKKLLDDLEPDVQMVLLNAVFLRAKWKTMFRKHTIKEEFFRPGLPPFNVSMMTSKKYPVAAFVDNSLQAKVGQMQLSHNMSVIIIMPRSLSQNLSEVEKRLDADVLMSVMSKLGRMPFRPTIVTLPKFKVASSQDLISIVQRLDYGIFYDADLCGISEDEVAVTSALHKAVLEINEEGVEGAAATAVSLARTAHVFRVQQPFIFMVSKNNEFPVFLGRIHNPKAS